MAVDDVAQALQAMQDQSIRTRIAKGDLSGLRGQFDDDERGLLIDAAKDFPAGEEVEAYRLSEEFRLAHPLFARALDYTLS